MNPETISVGIITTVVGMGVVLCVLIFLAFLTTALTKVVESMNKPKKKLQISHVAGAAPVKTDAAAEDDKLNAKTVAIIMAAVAAATGKSAEQLKFTAIKRVHSANNAWSNAGTAEIMNTRQNYL